MICNTCKRAGQRNNEAFYAAARETHSRCLYPSTCTCQHQTGDGHLNELAITSESGEIING